MKLILILVGIFSQELWADANIPGQFTFALGSISVNYTENPDQLKATDTTTTTTAATPYAGTASAMPIAVTYEYFPNLKRAYFVKAVGPLMGSTPDRYYSAIGGVNFFFGKVATMAVVSDMNFEMKLVPKMRYYAGPTIGLGYLVYNTKSATKNDTMFEIGGQGGVIYSLGPKWALRGEVGAARGIGVLVSSTIIKILLGTSYTIGN